MKHTLMNVDLSAMTATCVTCGPGSHIHLNRGNGRKPTPRCTRTGSARTTTPYTQTPQYRRLMWLKRYGLTPESYLELRRRQNNRCAVCERKPLRLFIDHDHGTHEVRGLLCRSCNLGLGHFRDDPVRLAAAARYLARAAGAPARPVAAPVLAAAA